MWRKTQHLWKVCLRVHLKLPNSRVPNWRQFRELGVKSRRPWRKELQLAHSEPLLKTKSWKVTSYFAVPGTQLMCLASAILWWPMEKPGCSNHTPSLEKKEICQFRQRKILNTSIMTKLWTKRGKKECSLVFQSPKRLKQICLSNKNNESKFSMILKQSINAASKICFNRWHYLPSALSRRLLWILKKSKSTLWCSAWPTWIRNIRRRVR